MYSKVSEGIIGQVWNLKTRVQSIWNLFDINNINSSLFIVKDVRKANTRIVIIPSNFFFRLDFPGVPLELMELQGLWLLLKWSYCLSFKYLHCKFFLLLWKPPPQSLWNYFYLLLFFFITFYSLIIWTNNFLCCEFQAVCKVFDTFNFGCYPHLYFFGNY